MFEFKSQQFSRKKPQKNIVSKIVFLLVILIIVLGGTIATFYFKQQSEINGKEELLKISDVASAAVNFRRLTTLKGNKEDLDNPDYQRLKEQLVLINESLKTFDAKWIYLIKNENGKWFFAVDPLPENSPNYTTPGTPYDDYPKGLDSILLKKETILIGPYSDRWGEFISAFSPIKNLENGEVLGVLGVDIDTSSWKLNVWKSLILPITTTFFALVLWILFFIYRNKKIKNEKEIKSREDQFRSITETIKDVICRLDLSGKIIYASPATEQILGFPQKEVLGKNLLEFVSPSEYQRAQDALEKLRQGSNVDSLEILLNCKNGKTIQADINIAVIKVEQELIEIQVVIRDVTQKKENEKIIKNQNEELKKSQAAILNILEDVEKEKEVSKQLADRLELATRSAKIGVFEWDIAKNYLIWDEQTESIFGNRNNKLSGTIETLLNENVHPDDKEKFSKKIAKALKDEKELIATYRVVWPDKSVHYLKTCSLIKRNNGKKPIKAIGVIWDVTQDMEIDKAKTEFVSLASHQLRTPLSAINWYAEMLLAGDAGKLDKEQKQYVGEIYHGNQRMVELVNSLLNVSRLELGTFSVEPESAKITEIADDIIKELKPEIAKKKIKFSKQYDKNIPTIMLDKKLTTIIFQNLLSNAIKYTPTKGKVELDISVNKKDLLITVTDTGLGIPLSQKDKIFTKMFRADNVRASDTEGTGLGLYIVKSIIDNVGGKILFTSEENKGTTFNITLPLSGMKEKEGNKTLA